MTVFAQRFEDTTDGSRFFAISYDRDWVVASDDGMRRFGRLVTFSQEKLSSGWCELLDGADGDGDIMSFDLEPEYLDEVVRLLPKSWRVWLESDGAPSNGAPPPTLGRRVLHQHAQFGKAVGMGVATATLDQAGDALLAAARKLFGARPWLDAMLADADGREVVKFLMAYAAHAGATYGASVVPFAGGVQFMAEMQASLSTHKLIAPRLAQLMELLKEFGQLGECLQEGNVGALGAGADTVDFGVNGDATRKPVRSGGR